MRVRRFVVLCAAAALILAAVAAPAMAPDAVKVTPDKYRVPFENEKVRLLEYRDKPGAASAMHSHPAHLVYVFESGKRKFTFPDGKSVVADLKAGDRCGLRHSNMPAKTSGRRTRTCSSSS